MNDESRPKAAVATPPQASDSIVRDDTHSVKAPLAQRRLAALRCEPLRCSHRDPLIHEAAYADDQLEAWRLAVRHLLSLGLPAVVPAQVRRALGSAA